MFHFTFVSFDCFLAFTGANLCTNNTQSKKGSAHHQFVLICSFPDSPLYLHSRFYAQPTPHPTPKPFMITSPPTPRPTPRPVISEIPPSGPSGPTLHAGGGSPSDDSFHCAEVTYTANWNELVDIDCNAVCSGLGMNSECPSGHQCRSDEGRCL